VSVDAGQGALQCKISTFLVAVVPTSAPNTELRDSRMIVLSYTPSEPYSSEGPFVQTLRELTLPK